MDSVYTLHNICIQILQNIGEGTKWDIYYNGTKCNHGRQILGITTT